MDHGMLHAHTDPPAILPIFSSSPDLRVGA
jgi:hypothetical protein